MESKTNSAPLRVNVDASLFKYCLNIGSTKVEVDCFSQSLTGNCQGKRERFVKC